MFCLSQECRHDVIRGGCEQRRVSRQRGARARERVVCQQPFDENANFPHGAYWRILHAFPLGAGRRTAADARRVPSRRLVQPGTNRGQTGGKGIIPNDGRDGERRRVGGRAAGTSSAAAASPESATG